MAATDQVPVQPSTKEELYRRKGSGTTYDEYVQELLELAAEIEDSATNANTNGEV